MNIKFINIILIVGIIVVLLGMILFGVKIMRENRNILPVNISDQRQQVRILQPTLIINLGKESEARDTMLENDILKISNAVREYAKDHDGLYPKSDFRNPCTMVRFCLKNIDINTKERVYLSFIPQVQPDRFDYHYIADNNAKTYCIKTPFVLETQNDSQFQCTQSACGRVLAKEACQ